MHDFEDGRGSVPAHQHPDGQGWVSKFSYVSPDSYVGLDSAVYGSSSVIHSVISDNSKVADGARVYESVVCGGSLVSGAVVYHAVISHHSMVRNTREVFTLGPIGPRDDYLTVIYGQVEEGSSIIRITAGCWTGSLSAFARRVEKTYGDSGHGMDYRAAIHLIKTMTQVEEKEQQPVWRRKE